MLAVVLSLHLLVCICLIGLVLLQRSEGGALGIGGGGGGALMSGRGAADALARMTSFAGAFFLATSLGLTVISGATQSDGRSVLDSLPQILPAPASPAPTPEAAPDPLESAVPSETQLAAASEAITLAPAPANASTRAGPVEPQQVAAPTVQPAALSAGAQTRPPANQAAGNRTPQPRTQNATSQPAAVQSPPAQQPRPLVLPNTSGATLQGDAGSAANLTPESGEGAVLEPVRRERAGPDQ